MNFKHKHSNNPTKPMRQILLTAALAIMIASCGNQNQQTEEKTTQAPLGDNTAVTNENPSYDPNRGEGKFTTVDLGDGLNKTMADAGNAIQGVKCASCHKLTDERLVGPGWKGVTERRTPAWIMNFITNPDPMIDKDPEVQAQLEICLVRMPNQGLTDDEARNILEFMRQNDGVK
jgi:hypothetical protein